MLFEPWYENYQPNAILAGAVPRPVRLREPDWSFDEAELRAAFGPRTRAVFLCHPNNPTGKVYRADELALLAELCQRWDAVLVVDSIYEHIHYLDPAEYLPPALVPGLEDRTVTVNAMSKTYAVTGWRVGWTVAPPELTAAIRKVHDFLTIAAPAPMQAAGVVAMGLPAAYYAELAAGYRERRDLLCAALEELGFGLRRPDGSYYVLCDIAGLDPAGDGVAFARRLITEIGVSCVPGGVVLAPGARRRRPQQDPFRVPEAAGDPARGHRAAAEAALEIGCRRRGRLLHCLTTVPADPRGERACEQRSCPSGEESPTTKDMTLHGTAQPRDRGACRRR